MGCNIVENSEVLGKVKDISRLPQGDYFVIDTNSKLIEEGLPKSFMLPYIPNFIVSVDIDSKTIDTTGAKDILEAS
jgi:16S rRNA processing protein RimM